MVWIVDKGNGVQKYSVALKESRVYRSQEMAGTWARSPKKMMARMVEGYEIPCLERGWELF
jgi:hypothetical protein